MKRAWIVVAAIALFVLLFAQRPTYTQAQVAPCPSGIITILVRYKELYCAPGPTPTPTPAPTPTPTPTAPAGTTQAVESPQAMGAAILMYGTDGNTDFTSTSSPFQRMSSDLQLHRDRVTTGSGASSANLAAGFTLYQANQNTGYCGSMALNMNDIQLVSKITTTIQAYETATTGSTGNTLANRLALGCAFFEQQNEADNISPITNTLSTATTAGASVTETLSSGSSGCTSSNQYFTCTGIYIYVSDGAASETVQVTSSTSTTWTATFANAHAAGVAVSVNVSYNIALGQQQLWATTKSNATNPEFAYVEVTTVPFANAISHLTTFDAEMVSVSGNHLWSYADALNLHNSTCNAPAEQTSYNSWANEFVRALSFNSGVYSFTRGAVVGEAIFADNDQFGNGSATVPYVPSNASSCSAPQEIGAIYASFGPEFVYGNGVPVAALIEPVLTDAGNYGTLANAYLDSSRNPKPAYYAAANARAFLVDLSYSSATYTANPVTYYRTNNSDWCTGPDTTSYNNNIPTGCTVFHGTYQSQDGTQVRMWVQRIPQNLFASDTGGSAKINALYPQQTYHNADSSVNYGQYPGNTPPTAIPLPTPTNEIVYFTGLKNAQLYVQSATCNIPTNIEFFPSSSTQADATPVPIYTTAANTECHDFPVSGGTVTPQPNGLLPVTIPAAAWGAWIVGTTGATPAPIVTPIPMATRLPTPTPQPNLSAWPYNQYRSGAYNQTVAL